MSRVINTDSVGKQRNQQMRLAAELLRHLSQKASIDDEARDMAAALALCFKQVEDGVEEAMVAWEKRNYWNKVEQFRIQWTWVGLAAARLEQLIRTDAWDQMPPYLMGLLPHFSDITISKFTRNADAWQGAYALMMKNTPSVR